MVLADVMLKVVEQIKSRGGIPDRLVESADGEYIAIFGSIRLVVEPSDDSPFDFTSNNKTYTMASARVEIHPSTIYPAKIEDAP